MEWRNNMGRQVTTKLVPPSWNNFLIYANARTVSGLVVPDNVYQLLVYVQGAGGSGGANSGANGSSTGGGGGGFICGIYDVTPGQVLPTITIGAGGAAAGANANGTAGGSSSFGTIATATGGGGGIGNNQSSASPSGGAGGTSTNGGLRNAIQFTGGRGGSFISAGTTGSTPRATGGGASGSIIGNGGRGGDISTTTTLVNVATGGGAWGGGNGGDVAATCATAGQFITGGGTAYLNGSSKTANTTNNTYPSNPFVGSYCGDDKTSLVVTPAFEKWVSSQIGWLSGTLTSGNIASFTPNDIGKFLLSPTVGYNLEMLTANSAVATNGSPPTVVISNISAIGGLINVSSTNNITITNQSLLFGNGSGGVTTGTSTGSIPAGDGCVMLAWTPGY
jgi:hypothetical protein